jgi:uncharacterized protein (TIGR02117 family)
LDYGYIFKLKAVILIHFVLIISGCLRPVSELYPEDEEQRPHPVYILSHGWHVGIAIESHHIIDYIPDHERLPITEFLKFGWGDNKYYPHQDPGFGLLLRAALLPTRSVLHVVGIDIPVENFFAGSDIIKVKVSDDGMNRLTEFIVGRFRLNDQNGITFVADGYHRNSAFFEATGRYFVPKTSNTWTARALRQTGAPITPFFAVTSGNVIYQSRQFGEVINLR